MTDSAEKMLVEIRDRTTRLESRMVQLGDYVGANLRSRQKIEIVQPQVGDPHVVIDSLDVSVSRILTELRQANLHVRAIDVYVGNSAACAFTLFPNQG